MRSRNRNKELREVVVTKSASNRIIEEEAREKSQNKDRIYIQGGVGLAALMVIASLSLYAFPDMFKPGEQIAEEQNILLLEECRQVFQSIGIMLSEGQLPDSSLRCPGTNVPNIIRRDGNKITVLHPNPFQFGLSELSVTNDSHRVVMVGRNQG